MPHYVRTARAREGGPLTNSTAGRPARRTPWSAEAAAPVRTFLRTESGSAGVLRRRHRRRPGVGQRGRRLATSACGTPTCSVRLGDVGITRDLRTWVNSGLMTLFFLVVGLEARREIDLGDLRDRRRFLLPARGRAGRHGRPGADLPGRERRRPGRRTGGAWRCRPTPRWPSGCSSLARPRRARPGARLPAHRVRGRRPRRAGGDRVRLQRRHRDGAAGHRRGRRSRPGSSCSASDVRTAASSTPCSAWSSGRRCWPAASTRWSPAWPSGSPRAAYSPGRGDLEQATGLFRLFREQPTPELARDGDRAA